MPPPEMLPVFDPRVLARMESLTHGNGQPLAQELLKGYVLSEPADLKRLEELLGANDGEKLAFRAHSFAGHAAAIGAVEVRAVALALEHDARVPDWDAARRRLDSLKAATSRLRPVLQAASRHLKAE
jgi:HPt (histidine-containing phosphotransfer) domain-containing protein